MKLSSSTARFSAAIAPAAVAIATVHAANGLVRLLAAQQGWSVAELLPAVAAELLLAAVAAAVVLAAPIAFAAWASRPAARFAAGSIAAALGVGMVVGLQWLVAPPGGARADPPEAPLIDRRTVVLVTTDTLRRDHVSAYPGAVAPDLTPAIDRIASEGVLYLDATAAAPLTLPSHTSMLSGRLPLEHGVTQNGKVLPADLDAAPAAFGRAGFATGGFPSASVLHGSHGLSGWFHTYRDELGSTPGLVRLPLAGAVNAVYRWWFEVDDPRLLMEPGDRTVARALTWLDRQGDNAVFLWVHLYDPHAPHAEHPHLTGASTRGALAHPCDWAAHPAAARRKRPHPVLGSPPPLPPTERCRRRSWDSLDARIDGYAREVRFLDRQVATLRAGLEAAGRWDGAVVIVVADHGESLVEQQHLVTHQYSVYESVVRVPLIVRAPGVSPGTEARPSHTVRVGATLLALAGLDPLSGMALPLGAAADPLAVSMGPAPTAPAGDSAPNPLQAAVRGGGLKVILDETGHIERYDLAGDPLELVSRVLPGERAAAAARIAARDSAPPGPLGRIRLPNLPLLGGSRRRDPRSNTTAEALAQDGVLGTRVDDGAAFAAHEQAAHHALQAARHALQQHEGDDQTLPDEVRKGLEALGYLH